MSRWYYLAEDRKTPVLFPVDSNGYPQFFAVEESLKDHQRNQVRIDLFGEGEEQVRVSTVFLGLDHGYGEDPPILWETMIFGGEHDEYQERYSSYDDAVAGHQRAVDLVTGGAS